MLQLLRMYFLTFELSILSLTLFAQGRHLFAHLGRTRRLGWSKERSRRCPRYLVYRRYCRVYRYNEPGLLHRKAD